MKISFVVCLASVLLFTHSASAQDGAGRAWGWDSFAQADAQRRIQFSRQIDLNRQLRWRAGTYWASDPSDPRWVWPVGIAVVDSTDAPLPTGQEEIQIGPTRWLSRSLYGPPLVILQPEVRRGADYREF